MQDAFVTMLALLNGKIQEQQDTISELRSDVEHKESIIDDLKEDYRILDSRYSSLLQDREHYATSYERASRMLSEAQDRIVKLEQQLRAYHVQDPALQSKAESLMVERHKEFRLAEGAINKIGAIKEVRLITGWGLKESKDFVEAWFAKYPAA